MRVHVKSLMPCSVERMWEALQSAALLMEVTPGNGASAVIEPVPMPARWTDAGRIVLQLPGVGRRVIEIERVDPVRHVVQTREHDALVRSWRHTMEVTPGPNGQAWFADTVEIEAGVLTPAVWVLAQALYRARHRGWRRVLAS